MDRTRRMALIVATFLAPGACALASKVETWRQDSVPTFSRGKKERVVVTDSGRVRLARGVEKAGALDATHVWDLARGKGGVLYAATGSDGKVFRREGQGAWTVLHDDEDSQVLSVAVTSDGKIFAGTGPGGRVVEVGDPGKPSSKPLPDVKYIWDLAADGAGNLYAATGPTGQLWKRSAKGEWSLLLDSRHPHLLCVAVGRDGSVYAGSDGEGLIYKVAPGGKVSVLYDAPQNEIRALLIEEDGTLYAGTSAEAAAGPGGIPPGPRPGGSGGAPGSSATPGGTVVPRPGTPGENAVYRIGSDGAPREIFRAKTMVYSLAFSGKDDLLIGTGPEGLIHEVRVDARESAPLARIDHGQALALLAGEGGEIFVGAGDPGGVLRIDAGSAREGTITSDVLDAKLVSRFGTVSWKADLPEGAGIALQIRTGNVGEPDATWSDWSAPLGDAGGARPEVPPGRFAQYRATLKAAPGGASPELRSVSVLYQTANSPPEIARVVVPDATAADGSPRPPRVAIRWDASDPNDDELAYTLRLRKEGWPEWITITELPLTDKTYNWDATSVPAGTYRLRVVASDRPSNPSESALTRELESEPFVIDHLPPAVTVKAEGRSVRVTLKDDFTRIVRAAYSLDGGEWVPIFPEDGLFDATSESIRFDLSDAKSGAHVITVRATDAAGNVGAGDAVFRVK